jgi:hypothetical protein
MRWETRYSSAEMGYLEIDGRELIFYLNVRANTDERWTFEEVLNGAADYVVNSVYGSDILDEIKAEIKRRRAAE